MMKLPIRLYKIIQEQFANKIVKPSISKDLEKLQIDDVKKEEAENEIISDKNELPENNHNERTENILDSKGDNLQKEIGLLEYIKDLDDFEEILHVLNMKGEKQGVQFKKGNIQYYSNRLPKYKSIICNKKIRNKKKKALQNIEISDSFQGQKEKVARCPCFYRIKLDSDGKVLSIAKSNENHTGHDFLIKKYEFTNEMKQDLSCFNKNSKIHEIKIFLENKFKVELSYRTIYSEFRKAFPLLGPKDALVFIQWCENHGYEVAKYIDEENKSLTKILIVSDLMRAHYSSYGDVVLIDSTYRVNKYKLPYVLFSGFTHKGRNCIFAVGIVNDETQDTFRWLLERFLEFHKTFMNILVSDHDLALATTLKTYYPEIIHILCQWHIKQSFNKNFSYLSAMNYGYLKEKIITLIWLEDQDTFSRNYEEIIKDLEARKLHKSINYLKDMHSIRNKWARSFLPWTFTGGVHTTSRVESVNSLIKRYVNSGSEVVDFIQFIVAFEKKY